MKYCMIGLLLLIAGCSAQRVHRSADSGVECDAEVMTEDVSVPAPVDCHDLWVDYVLCIEEQQRANCWPECKVLWSCIYHDQGITLPSTCDHGWPE